MSKNGSNATLLPGQLPVLWAKFSTYPTQSHKAKAEQRKRARFGYCEEIREHDACSAARAITAIDKPAKATRRAESCIAGLTGRSTAGVGKIDVKPVYQHAKLVELCTCAVGGRIRPMERITSELQPRVCETDLA